MKVDLKTHFSIEMSTSSQTLSESGWNLAYALNHKELVPFISDYLFRKNIFTLGYLFLNLIFLGLLIYCAVLYIISPEGTLVETIKYFGYGCAITILLIPPHELLHGLAYKLCGAKQVSYKANWRKLYFMAVADKFITDRKSFYFIALLPVTIISLAFLLSACFANPAAQIMWLTVTLVHASMCAGDLGLLSFFDENKHLEMVTYDDVENETTYFYTR